MFLHSEHSHNRFLNGNRRRFLIRFAAAFGATSLRPALAAPPNSPDLERSAASLIKPSTQTAIDRGLAWLASRQNDEGAFGPSGYSRNIAVVSLAGLAFLSAGDSPGRGTYGAQID